MKEISSDAQRLINKVIQHSGEAALNGSTPDAAADRWIDAGYDDPEEVAEWLAARCFDPESAKRLETAGLTPEQAAFRTRAGRGDYEDTIGYKMTRGDLAIDEARRIITYEFWKDDPIEC